MKFNKREVLRHLYQMGYDEESALEELDNLIYEIQSLKNPLKLYRIVQVNSKKDINLVRPGIHYSKDKKSLIDNHYYAVGYGENKFLITIFADKSLINFEETLINNILYPNENEVTLKNGGKGVQILSIKKVCDDDYVLENVIKKNIKLISEDDQDLPNYIKRRYKPKLFESLLKKTYLYAYFQTENKNDFLDKLFSDSIEVYFNIFYDENVEEKLTKNQIDEFKNHLMKIYVPLATRWYHSYKKQIK